MQCAGRGFNPGQQEAGAGSLYLAGQALFGERTFERTPSWYRLSPHVLHMQTSKEETSKQELVVQEKVKLLEENCADRQTGPPLCLFSSMLPLLAHEVSSLRSSSMQSLCLQSQHSLCTSGTGMHSPRSSSQLQREWKERDSQEFIVCRDHFDISGHRSVFLFFCLCICKWSGHLLQAPELEVAEVRCIRGVGRLGLNVFERDLVVGAATRRESTSRWLGALQRNSVGTLVSPSSRSV